MSGELLSREEFEAWTAAAAEARRAGGGGGSNPDDTAVSTAAVVVEQVCSARASPPGIDWVSLFQTVLDQLLFLGFFAWLATPATRESGSVFEKACQVRKGSTSDSFARRLAAGTVDCTTAKQAS